MFSVFLMFISFDVQSHSTEAGWVETYIRVLDESIRNLKADIGRYPNDKEGLAALYREFDGMNAWNGPYIKRKKILTDRWGQDFIYIYPPRYGDMDFDLYSIGKNGVDEHGGGDDIANWAVVNGE